jgi:hypothetical protein
LSLFCILCPILPVFSGLSLFCILCPILPVSLDCLCFVSCAQYYLFLWIVFVLLQSRETGNIGHKTQNKDIPEKQVILDARHKTKTIQRNR